MNKRSRFFSSSSNPFLSEESFSRSTNEANISSRSSSEHMTVSGAVNKSLILGAILIGTAFFAAINPNPMLMWIGIIGGLISVLVASFRPTTAPIAAPLYAVFEGLALGTISIMFAKYIHPSIVMNAILLTMLALFSMLILYRTGVIKATERFRSIVMTATGAIAILYLVNMMLGLFGIHIPYLHQGGPIGIGISLVIVGIASMNLILDFDQFEKGEAYQAPKYMEWMASLGLLVTLVWLYIEILRLLAMFSGRD
jgi:uncharacterized YccA/Bax inhibitor family protein